MLITQLLNINFGKAISLIIMLIIAEIGKQNVNHSPLFYLYCDSTPEIFQNCGWNSCCAMAFTYNLILVAVTLLLISCYMFRKGK